MSVLLTKLGVRTLASTVAILGLVGCSEGTEESSLPRSQTPAPTRTPASSKGTKSTAPTPSTTPHPSSAPVPVPDAGAIPTPVPAPPVPGSCGAPTCFELAGVGGCKATDAAGDLVTMGCQDGTCACLTGGQTTTFDGDVNNVDDARSLFLVNCTCN